MQGGSSCPARVVAQLPAQLPLKPRCRALNPARTAAATLLRYQQAAAGALGAQPAGQVAGEDSAAGLGLPPGGELRVLGVEHYSREPQDW